MGFLKVVKNKSYFSRYQVKYRRRREGKTDYARRRKLIVQDKTKFASHKYRLVVRITNRDTICQIVYSKIQGDFVLAAAYGHELVNYGIPIGHTNYAGVYATGLLLARRTLKKLGLADKYQGNQDINGEDYNVTPVANGPRPFKAFLDVGLARTSTGTKVFAALKGATDGGLNIPHSVSRFVGYDTEGKKLDAEVLRNYIFGGHVADYMREMEEEDPGTYEKHFSNFISSKLDADNLEEMYANAHKKIRANPDAVKKAAKKTATAGQRKKFSQTPLTARAKKHRAQEKKASILKKN
eukprot:TRINITY_DN12388_c0_g1_i1.p1 TRINITY_DN12388_c0_g1~~TRINITY_DN12388_c0_g1_i1.p1  ORF type:complete len:296 (-),score=168.57 TRINITY_DN12388_c0_g1_i1:77-964(-)